MLRGAPVVYYGDEFGIVGRGGDKEARHDLFPTQVAEWRSEERIGSGPIGAGSSFDQAAHPVAERLRTLGELRASQPVLVDRRDDRAPLDQDRARGEPNRRRRPA